QLLSVNLKIAKHETDDTKLEDKLEKFEQLTEKNSKEFFSFVKSDVLDAAAINIDPLHVVDIADDSTRQLFALFAQIGPKLNDLIALRVSRYESQMNIAIYLAVATTLLLIYVFAGFYVSVNGSVRTLSDATKRMIAGTNEEFTLKTKDELAA